jgi:predicted RNase H-like HicB family nuclease
MATVARRYSAVVYREDNWYVAECPEVGTASQGKTIEEAVANLKEATELYLEAFTALEGGEYFLTSFAADVRA